MAGLINTGRDSLRLPLGLARALAGALDRTVAGVGDQLRNVHLTTIGDEFIPESGGAIVASNHAHLLDSRLLNAASPRALTTVDVPSRVGGGELAERDGDSLSVAIRLLAQDELVLVFPEGRRSPDRLVHKGRAGLGELVLRAQADHAEVSVIPASVSVAGVGATVRFGRPLRFDRFVGLPIDRTLCRGVTDEVMAAIVSVAQTGYRDTYSATAREAQREQAREQVRERRRVAAAQRVAERAAVQAHRIEVAEEVADLNKRQASAAQLARDHARLAAERDARRDEAGG